MSEILFLSHRIPFPPDRGDKIRSHHILRRLAQIAPVHAACFAESADDRAHEAELASVAATHCLARRTTPVALAAIEALARGLPVSLPAFASLRIARFVRRTLAKRPISAIYVFSGQMAQYIPEDFAGRVVMDFVDVDSAKFEAYAKVASLPAKVMYRREARLLRRYEEAVARRVSVSLLVTPEEAALLRSRLRPAAKVKIEALGNGIDADFFNPAGIGAAPEMMLAGPQITFTGQMDYPPNIAAVQGFARNVMPEIRKVFPQACFNVVGRAPSASVLALDGRDGCRVTGAVADVRPWLAGADLVVAPLEIARGVQNKVLEAMAMARPVLVTSAAATGIGARDGAELAIADGTQALAHRAIHLLGDQVAAAALAAAGRRFVVANKGWDCVLSPLHALTGFDRRDRRDAA